jgi:hypothetical protein
MAASRRGTKREIRPSRDVRARGGEPGVERTTSGREGRGPEGRSSSYVIKTEVRAPGAPTWSFPGQRTMYGGKRVAAGDEMFVFASENEGGRGLVARGLVTSAVPVPRIPGLARQTPCVSVTVRRTAAARRPLGRAELRGRAARGDGGPEAELDFKLYRQATNKVVGVSAATAAFLRGFFPA